MKDRFSVTIEHEIVREIDEVRGLARRSAWIEDRLKKALLAERKNE